MDLTERIVEELQQLRQEVRKLSRYEVEPANLSGGSADRLAYWTGGSSLSYADALYWDSTNNRLGIGNTAPSGPLHATLSASGFNDGIKIESTDVSGASGHIRLRITHQVADVILAAYSSGAPGNLKDAIMLYRPTGGGKIQIGNIGTAVGDDLGLFTGGNYNAPQFLMKHDGKIGIGNVSPVVTLDVNGSAFVRGAGLPTAGQGVVVRYDVIPRIEGYDGAAGAYLGLSIGQAYQIYAHPNGSVGINTDNPTSQLFVVGDIGLTGSIVGGESEVAPNLVNGWANFGGGWEASKYHKDLLGRVHLSGLLSGTSATGSTMFTLPAGYRPLESLLFTVWGRNSATASEQAMRINVNSTGVVAVSSPVYSNVSWISLSNIAFKADA